MYYHNYYLLYGYTHLYQLIIENFCYGSVICCIGFDSLIYAVECQIVGGMSLQSVFYVINVSVLCYGFYIIFYAVHAHNIVQHIIEAYAMA